MVNINVEGLHEKQAVAAWNVGTISACASTPSPTRTPTGVEMVGRSAAGPSGCILTCSQQQSGKLRMEIV